MKMVVNLNYLLLNDFISSLPASFASLPDATTLHEARNVIKSVNVNGLKLVIKYYSSFSLINRVVYGRLRRSKSMRAYDNAHRLQIFGVNTPQPIAAIDCRRGGLLRGSYFVSEFSDFQPMTVLDNEGGEDKFELLEALARFIAHIHQLGILHNDLNPANVRFRQSAGGYEFELIDNNRMQFKPRALSERERINDLRHFTCGTVQFVYMLDCYAELTGIDRAQFAAKALASRTLFDMRYAFRNRMKSRLRRR